MRKAILVALVVGLLGLAGSGLHTMRYGPRQNLHKDAQQRSALRLAPEVAVSDLWSNGPNGINEFGPRSDAITSSAGVSGWHSPCCEGAGCVPTPDTPLDLHGLAPVLSVIGLLIALLACVRWGHRLSRKSTLPPALMFGLDPRDSVRHRCGWCHDHAPRPELDACRDCGALLHSDCWGLAMACPTLGCGVMRPQPLAAATKSA